MFDFFKNLYNSLLKSIESIVLDVFEFFKELLLSTFQLILDALAFVIEAIPFPDFFLNGGLDSALNSIPNDVIYFLVQSGFTDAMSVLSLGISFRMLRKLVTFFQW